jgi:hypothetical protein
MGYESMLSLHRPKICGQNEAVFEIFGVNLAADLKYNLIISLT